MPNFRLVSCWSKAGVGTSIVLEYGSDSANAAAAAATDGGGGKSKSTLPRIVLDMGATPIWDECIPAKTVLISHGHLDHIGAIFSHARAHAVSFSGSVPTYFVPEAIREKVEHAKSAMAALDGNDRSLLPMNIVGVEPGKEYELPTHRCPHNRRLFCRVFGVTHASCPAVGYVIGTRHAPVLKEEYRGLDNVEIRDLIGKGVPIKTEPRDELEVSYTGDTSVEGLVLKSNVPYENEDLRKSASYTQQAFKCPMLLCEASFLDDSQKTKAMASERGHLHIDDIARMLAEHKFVRGDRQLVLLHISGRYSAQRAMDHIADVLPSYVATRCLVAMASHLDQHKGRETVTLSTLVRENGCILLEDYIEAREKRPMKTSR